MNTQLVGAAVVVGLVNLSPIGELGWASARFETITKLAEAKMREYGVPGAAIGIIENGVVTVRGLGITNVGDPLPVTAHTVFPIASISKTFTAP